MFYLCLGIWELWLIVVVDAYATFEFVGYGSFFEDENGACIGMFAYYPMSVPANIGLVL